MCGEGRRRRKQKEVKGSMSTVRTDTKVHLAKVNMKGQGQGERSQGKGYTSQGVLNNHQGTAVSCNN